MLHNVLLPEGVYKKSISASTGSPSSALNISSRFFALLLDELVLMPLGKSCCMPPPQQVMLPPSCLFHPAERKLTLPESVPRKDSPLGKEKKMLWSRTQNLPTYSRSSCNRRIKGSRRNNRWFLIHALKGALASDALTGVVCQQHFCHRHRINGLFAYEMVNGASSLSSVG